MPLFTTFSLILVRETVSPGIPIGRSWLYTVGRSDPAYYPRSLRRSRGSADDDPGKPGDFRKGHPKPPIFIVQRQRTTAAQMSSKSNHQATSQGLETPV